MQHTIQQLMDKVSAMHGLTVQAHREKYKKAPGESYDVQEVTMLVEQIQALAGDVYNDRTPHPTFYPLSHTGTQFLPRSVLRCFLFPSILHFSLVDQRIFLLIFLYNILMMLRFFKGFRGQPVIAVLLDTYQGAFYDLIHFFFIFVVVFLSFAFYGEDTKLDLKNSSWQQRIFDSDW